MKSPEEILSWLQANLNYLEHDTPNERKSENFWPHKCEDCSHSIQHVIYIDNRKDKYPKDLDSTDWQCALGCIRYRDLSLEEYVALRIEEASHVQS